MIKILFVCHGSILKSPGKVCKINDFTAGYGTYYTTTTPFFWKSLEMTKKIEGIEEWKLHIKHYHKLTETGYLPYRFPFSSKQIFYLNLLAAFS